MSTATAPATVPPSTHMDAEQFRLLVEQVKDYGIFMLTPEGNVATWNAGAEAIKGYRAEEIIGRHFSRFYEADAVSRGWPQHELAMARSTGRFEDEGWRIRKDGTRFWASVVITALLDRDGSLRGFAKVTRDLTSRRRIEELQRSEARMNEFLAILAHELRNPLAPMRTALEIAERAGDDVQAGRYARALFSRQLAHLSHLVDDLLDLGRITSGRITYRFGPVDLAELVRSAVDTMRPLFDASGQAIHVRLVDIPTPLSADATRIVQVVTNLLSNASKYTPHGGSVHVTLEHDQDFALLQVTDDGMGIDERLLPLVFEPFIQGDRGLDRQGGGLGIGLTLVRRLVEAHGGTVAASSAGSGRGSTFSIRLPMRPEPIPAGAAEPGAQGDVPKLRVLVVDDNADIAESTAMLLRMLGHDVETALDGLEAIERARATGPDVVLLDIGLPRMSGYDVARALRAHPATRLSTIVACTGYGRDEDRDLATAAGFDRHTVKPVEAQTLVDILARAAERRAAG
ncbi:MAG TPA: ATP-binding protein [Casimicrobiaceae bacterium]|nr:ATP-binding protein [Casimicrobiaceae bacterium]